jgi:hypothetical protein
MADESVILTWNVPNWVTVGLMGATFFAALGLGMKIWQKRKGVSA